MNGYGLKENNEIHEDEATSREVPFLAKVMAILIVLGLAYIAVNVYAGLNAREYGMTTEDLRRELLMALFYFIAASVAFITVGKIRRWSRQAILVTRVAIALMTYLLISCQMRFSLELAPIKEEFTRVAEKCRVVARGEMKCSEDVAKVLAKRDLMLASINGKMYGEWRVTAPKPDTRVVTTGALYFFFPSM